MPVVVKRPLAFYDLAEIWSFIADDSEAAADRFLSEIESKLVLLSTQPYMRRERKELMTGLRSFPLQRYSVTSCFSCRILMESRSCGCYTAHAILGLRTLIQMIQKATPEQGAVMKVGYARVSTQDQRLDLQRQALTAAGCSVILEDQTSGTRAKRPGLDKALAKLGPGVVLVVWRLDRLGRSLSHLVEVLRLIEAKGAGFVSLTENIDTTSAGGRLVFHMMAALAEFERSLIVERTQAGLSAAKARGAKLGRRRLLSAQQVSHGRALLEAGENGEAVAASLGVSRATLYRALGHL